MERPRLVNLENSNPLYFKIASELQKKQQREELVHSVSRRTVEGAIYQAEFLVAPFYGRLRSIEALQKFQDSLFPEGFEESEKKPFEELEDEAGRYLQFGSFEFMESAGSRIVRVLPSRAYLNKTIELEQLEEEKRRSSRSFGSELEKTRKILSTMFSPYGRYIAPVVVK
jgi:hypothetical protein